MANKPYLDTHNSSDSHIFTRVFPQTVDISELEWHRDVHNRTVTIVESGGWKFQHDNEVPFELTNGLVFDIKAGEFHRVIKGHGPLVINIVEHP